MVDTERPRAEPHRKKGQPWVLPCGVGLQMTKSYCEEFPAHYPTGVMDKSQVKVIEPQACFSHAAS